MAEEEKTMQPEDQIVEEKAVAVEPEAEQTAAPEAETQEEVSDAEAEETVAEAVEEKKPVPVKKLVMIGASAVALIAAIVLFVVYALPAIRYSGAVKAYNRGDYTRAVAVFSALEDYKESADYLVQAELGVHYSNAVSKVQAGEYAEAIEEYKNAKDFQDAADRLLETYILYGDHLLAQNKYEDAIREYKNAKGFQDAKDRLVKTYILYGDALLAQNKYDDAIKEYRNASDTGKVAAAFDLKGEALFREKQYVQAAEAFASANNPDRHLDCGITLVEEQKDCAAAIPILESNTSEKAISYLNYANGMLSMDAKDYQAALDHFTACAGLLDADTRKTEATFLLAEKCLYDGYLNKAKKLYTALPEGYTQGDVIVADRIKLLNDNAKLLDLVGKWNATDTYYKVQADSTTSSYYYYWYQDGLRLGTVTVTCPYNGDGTFTIKGTATFPSYQNFSSSASKLKTDMETFTFRTSGSKSVPYQIDSSSTTKLTFNGRQFELQYKYVNQYSNVYWHYTYTSKAKYGTRYMLAEDM